MRPPYPVAIVPLLPQFLQRRRAKLDFPLRAMEELGIDRPALFFALNLAHLAAEAGATDADLGSPYATTHDLAGHGLAARVAAEGAGLVERAGELTRLTARGRELGERLRDATARHFASLRPIEEDELTRLADLLERAFQAAAVATEPERREHTARAFRFRGRAAPSSPLAALDHAVFGLWMVRDDCHLAAWRAAGIDGPALDVLTRIWRGEARSVDELAPKLTQQRAEDVAAAVERLRRDGRVAAGEPLTVSDEGRAFRERIEDETDRLFFAPWPEDVGEHGTWLEERLREVNAGLV